MSDLVSAWQGLSLDGPAYALETDLAVLPQTGPHTVTLKSYEEYLEKALQNANDPRLHLGLLPQPWCGDLNSATVFVLMLNPGLNPGDYYAEYRVPSFRAALISNLRSEPNRPYPLLFLDPEFSWHPGARYFRTRLQWLALALASQKGASYREALAVVARSVCCLQLVPYHSAVFRLPTLILDRLESTALSKAFVREHLLSRSDVLILVTRQWGRWGLPTQRNIVRYEGSETRAAHLSRRSRGGQALAKHFSLHDS